MRMRTLMLERTVSVAIDKGVSTVQLHNSLFLKRFKSSFQWGLHRYVWFHFLQGAASNVQRGHGKDAQLQTSLEPFFSSQRGMDLNSPSWPRKMPKYLLENCQGLNAAKYLFHLGPSCIHPRYQTEVVLTPETSFLSEMGIEKMN